MLSRFLLECVCTHSAISQIFERSVTRDALSIMCLASHGEGGGGGGRGVGRGRRGTGDVG